MIVESLITQHIDTWTSTVKTQSTSGRGSRKKLDLYGIKKLRELILELAVRGKLVPQDPNDEPASVLLERIAAEKAFFVKEKKIKKQKEKPNLNEIELPEFTLPIGWKWAFIPEVIAHDNYAIKRGPFGSALKKAYFVQLGYKVYEQQHAINDDFHRGEYYIDEQKFEELKAFEVKPFDLIISCSGTVGKVAIAPVDMEPGIINQALLKISLNTSALTNEYFKILFPAYYMKTETLSDLQGTAQKNMVSVDTLKNEPFPYPPIKEQHRIITKVDELMALCDQLEHQTEASIEAHQLLVSTLLNTLTNSADADELMENWVRISDYFDTLFTTEESIDQLKQTILQLAVMGKLVPQDPNDEPASVLLEHIAEEKAQLIKDKKIKKQKALSPIAEDEKPFELPNGWSIERLGNICEKMGSGSTPRGGQSAYVSNGIPFLRSQNVWNGELKLNDIAYIPKETHDKMENTKVYPGDVLLNITGASLGRSTIFPVEIPEANVSQHVTIIRLIEPTMKEFVHLGIVSPLIQTLVWGRQVGMAIEGLSKKVLEQFEFPIPPLEEQKRIFVKVNELMDLCEQLKFRLKESQTTQLHLTDAIVDLAV
jgi:type I restriction enzyme S subunit